MIGTLHRHDGLVTMVNPPALPPPLPTSTPSTQNQSTMPSSSLSSSSSCSSSSYSIINQDGKLMKEHDSGISEKDSSGLNDTGSVVTTSNTNNANNSVFIRVSINDQSVQKVLKFSLDETVWSAKHRLLGTLAKEIKDGLNYGFYLPPFHGRAGKFLDDSRLLREYPLNGQIANLEFKYKKRVYKFVKINQKELKALNVKSNYKKFLDLVRTNQVGKVEALLRKGLDPNFHSDLGETPLTIAASLAEPRDMIMALCEGGAHLDFRSRDSLTPMHKAAIIGNEKAIKCLLDMGSFADLKCSRMLTPLYYAVMNGSSVQCIEHLLFNGSPVGIRDENNWQEIHYACKLGMAQHLDHLLYYGADINARNNSGNTPLHVCAIHAQESCARILLFRGCNKHERNLANQTALDSALLAGSHVISELIQTHGDCDVVPIKDRPFYNTKRRSVYIGAPNETGKCYDDAASSSGGSSSSCVGSTATRSRSMSKIEDLNGMVTAASASFYGMTHTTSNTIIGISNILNGSQGNAPASNRHSVYNHQTTMNASPHSNSMRLMPSRHSTVLNPTMNHNLPSNSGSSSPISRSRSISSDEHGVGSLSGLVLSTVHHHHHNPHHQYTYQRQRLYPSIPNRTFICIKPHKPAQPGELELQLGDIIELLSVGDSGYWEGRICGRGNDTNSISSKGATVGAEGWFKATCVEEFCLPKDVATADDSIVVKRKTLIDLLTHNDSNAPRTVVLQKGKKGFGFVLRGAKTNENKFEPTPEWPALQFLESVDKDSNADKAGLKPLDFVLEINNVDVTCKTHFDCVKLIKKCGDTLVLKVYTPKKSLTNNFITSTTTNFNAAGTLASSTSTLQHHHLTPQHYHSPMSYRMSATMSRASVVNSSSPASSSSSSYYASSNIATMIADNGSDYHCEQQIYIEGTRTLPNKKNKPVPPKRDPNTSLTPSVAKSLKKIIMTDDYDYEVYLPSTTVGSKSMRKNSSESSNLMSKLLPNKLLSRSSSSICSSSSDNKKSPVKGAQTTCKCSQQNVVYSDNSGSYMSSALAQIDELDKTIAEYDSNNSNDVPEKQGFSTTAAALLISKTKLIADDANAASIRTRVPVRKPGINNGEIFNQQQLLISQKTMSVPNLLQQQQQNIQQCLPSPPLPPPPLPPMSQIPNLSTVMISQSITSNGEFIRENVVDTLVQHQQSNTNESAENNVDTAEYEPAHDYDVEEETRCDEEPITNSSDENSTILSSNSSSNVSVAGGKNVLPIGSSPLTPRQIKQRNTAKRNSMPKTNGTLLMNNQISRSELMNSCVEESGEDDKYTSSQLRDLEFLKSQQFDAEFIRTTGELFVRYPSAKISISVVSTNSSNEQDKTTRQVEIDKNMFDKICAYHQEQQAPQSSVVSTSPPKIQPPTPARTTSIPVVETAPVSNKPTEKQHKPGSHVDQLKQQFNQPTSSTGPVCVKSELERAIENRMRRTSQLNLQQTSNSESSTDASVNKRNLPRDPPPALPQVDAHQSFPPPPSPKQLKRLNSSTSTVTTPMISQQVPPPAPPLPTSFNSIKPSTTTIYQSNKTTVTNCSVNVTNNEGNKVKSIVNSLQQHQQSSQVINDPRMSSDFGALIAKKAAEKRAKFQENKTPVSNAVTFQPDGSKVFAQSLVKSSRVVVETNDKPTDSTSENPNESFISTASKLLERVKLQQQKQTDKSFVVIKQQ